MDEKVGEEGIKHLENIEQELSEIKDRTPGPRRAFLNGIMQGMGIVVGSIAAVVLLGWVLSILGIIPGFGDLAQYLQQLISNARK